MPVTDPSGLQASSRPGGKGYSQEELIFFEGAGGNFSLMELKNWRAFKVVRVKCKFLFFSFCCIPYNKSKCDSEWAGGEKYVGHVVCKTKLACSAAALPRGSCGRLDPVCFWDLPSPYSPHTHVVVVTKGRAFPPSRWSLASFHHRTKPLQPAHGQVQAPLSGVRCVCVTVSYSVCSCTCD